MAAPLVIAHRGDSSRALENSLEAVRLALSIPADMIELDVRKSRDNHLYLMHDDDTGRTADAKINIDDATEEEIARLKLNNGEPVPILAEVLKLVNGSAGLNLEIKSEGAGALTAAHIAGSGYTGKIVLSSFLEQEVIAARRILPNTPTAVIFDDFSAKDAGAYAAKGYRLISLRRRTTSEALIAACHDRHVQVYVWTVDDEEEMKKFIAWGVDGIYTNKPELLRRVVAGAGR